MLYKGVKLADIKEEFTPVQFTWRRLVHWGHRPLSPPTWSERSGMRPEDITERRKCGTFTRVDVLQ